MEEKTLVSNFQHLREFREFVAKHFTQSTWTQKKLNRAFKELSNDITTNHIRFITNELSFFPRTTGLVR
jgi:hypothetical protein